jgi:hypothetical protein
MAVNLDDYVDVAERIRLFYEQFPDGRLVGDDWKVITMLPGGAVGDETARMGRAYVVYEALAYRTADDPLPAKGVAWEPYPGATNFTKDSELMNAETSAIGRAIVNVGIGSKKVASKDEVQNRRGAPEVTDRLVAYASAMRDAIRKLDPELYPDESWKMTLDQATAAGDQALRTMGKVLAEELRNIGGDVDAVRDQFK